MTAVQGENIALSCFPPEGNPKPTITWLREGTIINTNDNGGKYSLDPSGVMLVNNVGMSDAGRYACRVSNEAGIRQDSPINLHIEEREEDSEYIDAEQPLVIIEDVIYLPSPVITEALLLDATTGLVNWLSVAEATSYTVRVTVGNQEITNISLEADVTQVKLHSLDPDLVYSVQLAANRDLDGLVSSFSDPEKLTNDEIKEVRINMSDIEQDLSVNIWIIGMVIVVILTLAVIISAVLIIHKIRVYSAKKNKDIESYINDSEVQDRIKRYSWIDRRWAHSNSQTFKSEGRLLDESSHYDYVVHSLHNASIYKPLSSSPVEVIPCISGDVYHYASCPIAKGFEDGVQKM